MSTTVTKERDGRVLLVKLHNPPHNFMTGEMVVELDELTRSLEGDRSVGAVVITGGVEGKFITHYDVEEILTGTEGFGVSVGPAAAGATLRAAGGLTKVPGVAAALERTPAAGTLALRRIHQLLTRIGRIDKVFIAAINGPAFGGGCELALACDLRYMSADAEGIGLPEITLGFNPGAGGTQRLSRIIGPGRALEAILEARAFTPEEASELGVVHRVVEPERLLDEARETAERMARRSPLAVAGVKNSVLEGAARGPEAGMAIERKWFLAGASRPAAQRAMRRYVDQVAHDRVPWSEEEGRRPWQEGTAVEMTGD